MSVKKIKKAKQKKNKNILIIKKCKKKNKTA